MRRQTILVALLALGVATSVGWEPSIPFLLKPEVRWVLADWHAAGLSCSEPGVGMPGPMAGWGCVGDFDGVRVQAGLDADAQGVFEIYVNVPAGTSDARTAGAFVRLLRATSLLRAAEAEMEAWLISSNAADGVMPVTSTTGIFMAHVSRGSGHPELFVVPLGSTMVLAG